MCPRVLLDHWMWTNDLHGNAILRIVNWMRSRMCFLMFLL